MLILCIIELVKKNQDGFSLVELLLVFVLIALIAGGFFVIRKAKHNLSSTVNYQPTSSANINNEKVSYKGYANAQACQDPSGLTSELSATLKSNYPSAEFNTLANTYKPTEASLKAKGIVYPLVIDADASAVGSAQIHWVFKLIPIDKTMATKLVNTRATISYKANGKSFTSAYFVIDDGACSASSLIQ